MLTDHHRIDNQGKCELRGGAGDGFHDGAVAQGPRLDGSRRNVLENGVQLREDELRRQALDAVDAYRVLDSEKRDDGFAVNSELVERFEVSLDASPAAGVRAGDGQCDAPHVPSIAGTRRGEAAP